MVEIDGSLGDRSGQILRTSFSPSLITQTPFRLTNIRASSVCSGSNRTTVRGAAEPGSADVTGDSSGSTELEFCRPISFDFAFGREGCIVTAGSLSPALEMRQRLGIADFDCPYTANAWRHAGRDWLLSSIVGHSLSMRVPEPATQYIGYRLNLLGVRVYRGHCHLVARVANDWVPIGSHRSDNGSDRSSRRRF